jgi:hypothetical protein
MPLGSLYLSISKVTNLFKTIVRDLVTRFRKLYTYL